MMRRLFFFVITIAALLSACSDNDSFTTDSRSLLSFDADTIKLDTLFSGVPSSTYSFWVHNHNSDGLRLNNVRLERGNQSGFRVNVDGEFLDPVVTNLEVRKGDSILVFVEVTTRENHAIDPQLVEDNLLFTLESGTVQKVNLRAWSWDALKIENLLVERDTTISSTLPIVIYGDGIEVAENATLRLEGTTLYFHDNAGILVKGSLQAENTILRGDRLDRMFDYLPYDRISGQWGGVMLMAGSKNNVLTNCEIRNAMESLVCDSTELTMTNCIVHNSRGNGLIAYDSKLDIDYCQFSNALGSCLAIDGGTAKVSRTTLAQFYPFSADRGAALSFSNSLSALNIDCQKTLVTGYDADVFMGIRADTLHAFDYHFADCILRTDSIDDAEHFERILWETPKDSVQGIKHFRNIDEDNLFYEFQMDSISPAFKLEIGRL